MAKARFTKDNIRLISSWDNNCAFACMADFLVDNLLKDKAPNKLSDKTKECLLAIINDHYQPKNRLTEQQLKNFFSYPQAVGPQDWQAIVGKALRAKYDARDKSKEVKDDQANKDKQVSMEVIGWLAKELVVDVDYEVDGQPMLDNSNQPKTEPVLHVSYQSNKTGGHFNRFMDEAKEAKQLNNFDDAVVFGAYEFIYGGKPLQKKPYIFSAATRDAVDGSFERSVKQRLDADPEPSYYLWNSIDYRLPKTSQDVGSTPKPAQPTTVGLPGLSANDFASIKSFFENACKSPSGTAAAAAATSAPVSIYEGYDCKVMPIKSDQNVSGISVTFTKKSSGSDGSSSNTSCNTSSLASSSRPAPEQEVIDFYPNKAVCHKKFTKMAVQAILDAAITAGLDAISLSTVKNQADKAAFEQLVKDIVGTDPDKKYGHLVIDDRSIADMIKPPSSVPTPAK